MAKVTWEHSRAALDEFDRTGPERDALWDNAQSNEDVAAAEAADEAARLLVCEAFHLDTQAFNNQRDCRLVSVFEIRRLSGFTRVETEV